MSSGFNLIRSSIHGRRLGLGLPGQLVLDGQLISASGVMGVGNAWYVRPHGGADTNDGMTPQTAVATVAKALSLATANQNDVVYLIAESNTAASTTDYQTALLDWNKDLTHLIGVSAPSAWSNRARIAQKSTTTGLTALMKVSANACIMSNFSIFHGVADATSLRALDVTGSRNYFGRLHIGGIGDATMVTAGAMSLYLNAASENDFDDCVIGLDTISRDQNCTEIKCDSSASRNRFRNCLIDSYISNAGFAGVTIGANGIDRGLYFDNCLFMAKSTNKAIGQTSVFSIPAISQGAIVLKGSLAFSDGGAVDWDSNNRGIIWNSSVAAAASAAGGILTNQ